MLGTVGAVPAFSEVPHVESPTVSLTQQLALSNLRLLHNPMGWAYLSDNFETLTSVSIYMG